MITFLVSILALVLGYVIYSKFIEKQFGADDKNVTPAIKLKDGVDFVELPVWKIYMIQLLNIAGLGPIFGAVLGAMYGQAAYIWIVFGCIFMGAVHDYFSGMLSLRSGGQSSSELTGKYLGNGIKNLTRGIYMILVVLVGAAFVNGPAGLLTTITEGYINFETWALIIFAYYVLATLLPIDKVIGRIYPFFGAALLFMALSIAGYLIFGDVHLQELSFANLKNYHIAPKENILFPMIFIVVSCGAISGFHATQSPMMARCLKKESHGRLAFYGAMITEGIIAIIWATAAINYFGGPEKLNEILSQPNHNPAWLVNTICNTWLGKTGAILAIIGVVACPITTGDTAYRSARLLIADVFKIDQKPIFKRVLVALPVFAIGFYLSKTDFGLLWKYVGILNQTLASIFLWTIAIYLAQKNKIHWYISIPATFLTAIVVMYFLVAPYSQGGLFLNVNTGYIVGCVLGLFAFGAFLYYAKKCKNQKFD